MNVAAAPVEPLRFYPNRADKVVAPRCSTYPASGCGSLGFPHGKGRSRPRLWPDPFPLNSNAVEPARLAFCGPPTLQSASSIALTNASCAPAAWRTTRNFLLSTNSRLFVGTGGGQTTLPGRVGPENWCRRSGLNTRPHPYQGCALPLSYGGLDRNLPLRAPKFNCNNAPKRLFSGMTDPTADKPKDAARRERLARQLRENLQRRKQQARARRSSSSGEGDSGDDS